MSQKGHKETYAVQQIELLLGHLVGTREIG